MKMKNSFCSPKSLAKLIMLFLALLTSLPLFSENIKYGTGSWPADTFGNHRAVVRVSEKTDAVWAHILWRRRDLCPEKKNIIIIDAASGERILNVVLVKVNRESGDIIFQPGTAPGDYYVYYLPYIMSGSRNYPTVNYPEPAPTAEAGWLERHGLKPERLSGQRKNDFPQAELVEIQSSDEFNSFSPMEVIATAEETKNLLARHPEADYLLFPEDRKYPIRMQDDLPLRWVSRGPQDFFEGEASRGEFFAFQVGLFACTTRIDEIDVRFSPMKGASSRMTIPSVSLCCFNTGGVNWDGKEFRKKCPVEKGKVYPLWCGVQVPKEISPGKYEGETTIIPKGMKPGKIKLILNVKDEVLSDGGDSELWRHSRLRWLDSRIAFDDEVFPPFIPLKVKDNTVSCLGRSLTFGQTGFPTSIKSLFSPEVSLTQGKESELLSSPIELIVVDKDNNILTWKGKGAAIKKETPGVISWEAESSAERLSLQCQAQMEFDGFVEFKVRLKALKDIDVGDIRLEVPLRKNAAKYMMGMGFKGGFRPFQFEWKWDQNKNQDSVWVGDVQGGVQFSFRDENYSRPLNTNFYLSKPLNMPPSWHNEGKGGCTIAESDKNTVLLTAYSGRRRIKAGQSLHFHFNLLLTPFKPLDTKSHFRTKFYHAYKPIEEVVKTGANTINIHHANEINPYINYPFLRPKEMKAYIDDAHQRGLKVKIYYTIRELSNRAAEIFALRSLGDEIFSRGPGGGFSWLQEHLSQDYIAAWFVPQLKDAAIINSGMSRWHNYYLEGLDWLAKNVGIDGLYIDDVAYDRTTMKRVRKILDRNRPGALIDLHSANQFNARDGFASSANLYLEHLPYINRLWFGEYFDYNSAPDYWLVEISGIPFGITGEMLQDGGNPWRGMVFGMTNRLPWSGKNPAHLWKVWDEFGIDDSQMFGYWSPDCPVRTDNEDVLATAYVKKGSVLVSVASWAKNEVNCRLEVDWKALGLDPKKALLYAPAIQDFQEEATFKPTSKILIEPGKGWLLILSEK